MVPLGLFPVVAATVQLILIQMNTGECLGTGPIANNVHNPGVLANKQLFIHSSRRERKDLECRQGYYEHPNKTHCCILCHKGYYVAQHCVSQDRTPNCQPCPEKSFMSYENFADMCRGCQLCRSSLGQVTVRNCDSTRDTECGCPSNYFQTDNSSEFKCKPCSTCQNGTVMRECSTFSDTVCKCRKGFFLQTQKNSCSPCSSCTGEDCKEDCEDTSPVTSPENASALTPILGSTVVVLAAGFLLLALRWLIKNKPMQKKLISAFSFSKQQPSPADSQLPQPEVLVTTSCQESHPEEMLLPHMAIPVPPNTQSLPDCIQPAGENQIPDSPAVLYAVVDNVPFSQWKEFVRRLGLHENAIDRILAEERDMRDAQYKMLMHWKQKSGQRTTVERISSVLNEMELSGCSEAIQEVLSRQA